MGDWGLDENRFLIVFIGLRIFDDACRGNAILACNFCYCWTLFCPVLASEAIGGGAVTVVVAIVVAVVAVVVDAVVAVVVDEVVAVVVAVVVAAVVAVVVAVVVAIGSIAFVGDVCGCCYVCCYG
jgi:hypothetical protein